MCSVLVDVLQSNCSDCADRVAQEEFAPRSTVAVNCMLICIMCNVFLCARWGLHVWGYAIFRDEE